MLGQQRREPRQINVIEQSSWYPSAISFEHAQAFQEPDGLSLGVRSQPRLLLQPSLLLKKPSLGITQSSRPKKELRPQDRGISVSSQGANHGRPDHHALTTIPFEDSPCMLVKLVPWITHARGSTRMTSLGR
jgi:hypothetical protein